MKRIIISLIFVLTTFLFFGCNDISERMPRKFSRHTQSTEDVGRVTLSMKGVSRLPSTRFFKLGEKESPSGSFYKGLDWSNQEGRRIPMHGIAYGYDTGNEVKLILYFNTSGVIVVNNSSEVLRVLEDNIGITRVRYLDAGAVSSEENNPQDISSSYLESAETWKVIFFTNDTMSKDFSDNIVFDQNIDVQSDNKANRFLLSNAKGCTIETKFEDGANGEKIEKNMVYKGLSSYNETLSNSNKFQTYFLPLMSVEPIKSKHKLHNNTNGSKTLQLNFENSNLRPTDCLVEYRVINNTGKDISLQSLEIKTEEEGHPVYYTSSLLDYGKIYKDPISPDLSEIVRSWMNVDPDYTNADEFRRVFTEAGDKTLMYKDNPYYTFRTPDISASGKNSASFLVRAIVNYNTAETFPNMPAWLSSELPSVGQETVQGKSAKVHLIYNDGDRLRRSCMRIAAKKDGKWFVNGKSVRVDINLYREDPLNTVTNPLEYMAEYNVNKDGTGFVESNDVLYTSGYFTFDDAINLPSRVGSRLKCYHVPSLEEWKSIAPDKSNIAAFRNGHYQSPGYKKETEENIKIGNDNIPSCEAYYKGMTNNVVYAVRLIGTNKYESIWRYAYETTPVNRLKIDCVLAKDLGITIDENTIHNIPDTYFNNPNTVTRIIPADGWYNAKREDIDPTYIDQKGNGLYWSSTSENAASAWRLFFSVSNNVGSVVVDKLASKDRRRPVRVFQNAN